MMRVFCHSNPQETILLSILCNWIVILKSAKMGRDMPERSTRGKRMRQAMEEQEDQADEQFWNQDFFQEEMEDIDYQEEVEVEDVPDSDFDEPVRTKTSAQLVNFLNLLTCTSWVSTGGRRGG